jgi:hypothetical protein
MRLTNLEKASLYEVKKWLYDNLELQPDQKRKLYDEDLGLIRRSPFYFYKKAERIESSFLWRLTIVFVPIYILILIVLTPINFLITGKWGYGQKFFDGFHAKWWRKMNL